MHFFFFFLWECVRVKNPSYFFVLCVCCGWFGVCVRCPGRWMFVCLYEHECIGLIYAVKSQETWHR